MAAQARRSLCQDLDLPVYLDAAVAPRPLTWQVYAGVALQVHDVAGCVSWLPLTGIRWRQQDHRRGRLHLGGVLLAGKIRF
jgi:hypothetical protein